MIKESRPVSIAEVVELTKDLERGEEVRSFVKSFDVLDFERAKALEEEIRALGLLKLKDEHVVKIVDFVPVSADDLNKVIIEVSLDADEVNKILDVTKKYR